MPLMRNAQPGYGALRKGRWSAGGRGYFLTVCVQRPAKGLIEETMARAVWKELRQLEDERRWHLRCGVIMPDHLHLLVTLGETTPLSGVVRLFKGRVSPVFRRTGLRWQPGFYDHCLRGGDDLLPVFLYVFLNPYRAGLADAATTAWPHYYCACDDWEWFGPLTREQKPYPEWLR